MCPDAPPPRPSRRGFLTALLAIPAALAACAGNGATAPDVEACAPAPAAGHPRVDAAPEFPRLRQFPLDADVPPAFVYRTVARDRP